MELKAFFEQYDNVAIAFSGGVDSAYLLYAARRYGCSVRAYYVKSVFQPQFEYEDALRLAQELDVPMDVIRIDVLSVPEIAANPANRCYICKKEMFGAMAKRAAEEGFPVLCDGTNASDDAADRPGMKALAELHVLSPLRICGLTKERIRELSREAGLFTWNKPAYACLATRIPTGECITEEKLLRTEKAEQTLFQLGFRNFRVRSRGERALLQLRRQDLPLFAVCRETIWKALSEDYETVSLDPEVRNEP